MKAEFALLNLFSVDIILCLILLAIVGFQIWMLIDCAIHETSIIAKVAWIFAILLLSLIGAAAYYFARKFPRSRGGGKQEDTAPTTQPDAPPRGSPATSTGNSGAATELSSVS